MNANDLTFGIEIETIASDHAVRHDGLRIGSYKHGIQVPYLPTGWTAEADGSINNAGGGHKCEIVSPILRGEEGIAQAAEVLRMLEAKGHRVNASCGVHVHVGWRRDWPSEALARLVTIVAYVEKGLYAITGSKSRERGTFCGGVRKYGNDKTAKPNLDRNRYHALNLTNLARGTKDTVEFRVFSGTTNTTKVVGWIQVCLGLVERALNGKRHPPSPPDPRSRTLLRSRQETSRRPTKAQPSISRRSRAPKSARRRSSANSRWKNGADASSLRDKTRVAPTNASDILTKT